MLVSKRLFFGSGSHCEAARTAVIAHVVRGVDDYRLVVGVVKISATDVVHICVVAELIVAPVAAFVPGATITEAIVDAAVEADFRPPIAVIPGVRAVAPAPITRRPEEANCRWFYPGAGHPEIAFLAVRPITGRPEESLLRAGGLRIDHQFWWCNRDGGAELRVRRGRNSEYYEQEQKKSDGSETTHFLLPCQCILRLPGGAFLLRVQRMEGLRAAHRMTQAQFQICPI